jgi:lipoprotein-anchoring transpeptidase ErfK/SrfK
MKLVVALWIAFGMAALAQTPAARPAQGTRPAPAAQAAPVVPDTLATQVMLDRAGFSPGEIDGKAGPNLKRALGAFQKSQGLTETAEADQETWKRLAEQAGQQAPLVAYEITDADLAGPFAGEIPNDLIAQSKLPALGYRDALEALGERFHASPRLLQELNAGATFAKAGERVMVPNVEPFVPPARQVLEPPKGRNTTAARGTTGAARGTTGTGRGAARGTTGARGAEPVAEAAGSTGSIDAVTVAVTKSTSALTVTDATGRVIFHAPVTSGSEHDPLPIGEWKVTTIHTMPVFNYNPELFWDANPKDSKAKIPAGPNNPVGVTWIDLSKEHYGIHGTSEPGQVGHMQSHGCVRLTNWDAVRVMQWIKPGTVVVFRE